MPSLEGMRVLDMTQYEAGTSCSQFLAWFGADVVKVEPPSGDPGRVVGKLGSALPGDGQYFMNYNGNKRSVVIDLKQPRGRALFLDLVPKFDVFLENYGPGVIEKLAIGYEELSKRHPRLIYGRIKGFGLSGPYSQFNSYDWVAQAAAGTFSVTGDPDGPPMHPGPSFADSGTGIQMALAVTAAYVEQQRTGRGQMIELSMQEAVTIFMRTLQLQTWGTEPAARQGIGHGGAGTSTYPCAGGGPNDWIFIMPATNQMWVALCVAIDREDLLDDPRFADWQQRREHASELYEEIATWTRRHSKQEAMEILGNAGVPCSKVFDTVDLFTDPHLVERDFIQSVSHPVNGEVSLMRNPIRMAGTAAQDRSPLIGEHTAEVLSADLGLDRRAIVELAEAGAIGLPELQEA